MARPKSANLKTFHLYDKLHTIKNKMYCGVELTILHSIKETKLYYTSIEVWAFCAGKFKNLKKNYTLSLNIPLLTDERTISILNKKGSSKWLEEMKDNKDCKEALEALNKIFPNKEKVYFHDLDYIIGGWCKGDFLSYDDEGNINKTIDTDRLSYYAIKYPAKVEDTAISELHIKAMNEKDEASQEKYFDEYYKMKSDYLFNHCNFNEVLINIGKNSVCYPFVFTDNTAEWSRQQYGKLVGYAHAGEIFFIQTPDKIFFSIVRHF